MNRKCQVFTPADYVEELLDSAGYRDNLYGMKVLENSCGNGNILVGIVQRYIDDCKKCGLSNTKIKNGLARDIYGIEIDHVQYDICLQNLNSLLQENGIESVDWNIYNADYLRCDCDASFEFIVGNPPYITYQELSIEERSFLKNNFTTCKKGKFDYCYAFIEKSLGLLSNNGRMAYLIPVGIFKTAYGVDLRNLIKPYMTGIKDFSKDQIFGDAAVKSAIIQLDRARKQPSLHYIDACEQTETVIPVNQLGDKWFFHGIKFDGNRRFGDYFSVSHSVATLLNEAYVFRDCECTETDDGYLCKGCMIEKEMVREAAAPRSLKFNRHERIIFPYHYENNMLKRIKKDRFEEKYHGTAAYLKRYKDKLNRRDSDKNAEWFEYGRSQALRHLNREKLLISRDITGTAEVYYLDADCIPYAGMIIFEKENDSGYTLKDAANLLRSDRFKDYVQIVGTPANGNSVRITARDIENYRF